MLSRFSSRFSMSWLETLSFLEGLLASRYRMQYFWVGSDQALQQPILEGMLSAYWCQQRVVLDYCVRCVGRQSLVGYSQYWGWQRVLRKGGGFYMQEEHTLVLNSACGSRQLQPGTSHTSTGLACLSLLKICLRLLAVRCPQNSILSFSWPILLQVYP